MGGSHITCAPRSDATPENELDVLAAIYCFILFESSASKEAAGRLLSPDGHDGTKAKGDSADAIIRH
jgi:hypothetical protein